MILRLECGRERAIEIGMWQSKNHGVCNVEIKEELRKRKEKEGENVLREK